MTPFAPVAAIGRTGRVVLAFLRAARVDGSRSGRSYAITLLTPIKPGAETALAVELDGLGLRELSPLAKLPFVHFGRWVAIDQLRTNWPGAPVPPPQLRSKYLLFSACVTAPAVDAQPELAGYAEHLPVSFFREIWSEIPGPAEAIWRHCVKFPGMADREAFVDYLARSQVSTSLFHVGVPDATVHDVRRAVAKREKLVAFALKHQGDIDAVALQWAYRQESAKWR